MSLPRQQTQIDEAQSRAGDGAFVGVDMRTPPQSLQPGYVSEAVNVRFRRGEAFPRGGMQALQWAFLLGAEFPLEFPIQFNTPLQIGEPKGVGKFNDPNGVEWIMIAAKRGNLINVYAVTPNNRVIQVPTTTAILAEEDTDYFFTQAFNTLILSRGKNHEHLSLTSVSDGFTSVSSQNLSTDSGTATEPIPNGPNATFFRNRVLIPNVESGSSKVDLLSVSDYLNYTKYLPAFGDFRINQGDSDELVRCVPFNDNTLIIFKESSIYQLVVPGADFTQAVLSRVTSEYGLVGQRTVIAAGRDLWFLSQWGITSLYQTEDNKIQGTSVPISEPMQPIIDRINWSYAGRTAVAAYYRDRAYFSVPIDGSTQNNCVLVYDFLNKAWAGYDYWDGDAKIAYFVKADYLDGEKLLYVDYDGILGIYEFSEQDTKLDTPVTYKAQVLVKDRPGTGNRVRINDGDWITADRTTTTNSGTTWGVGTVEDLKTVAAQNLYDGFDSGGWTHNADSVRQVDRGVEFTDANDPIDVRLDPSDTYALTVIADSRKKFLPVPIKTKIVTRGYHYQYGDRRRAINAQIDVGTLGSQYKVTVIQDGVSETRVVIDETAGSTRDSLSYTTFNTPDWVPTNANNDFSSPYREDYTVRISDTTDGDYALKLFDSNPDVRLNNYQRWTKRFNVERRGSYFQVQLEGIQGRTKLYAVAVGAISGRRGMGEII